MILTDNFELQVTKIQTIFDIFMNKNLLLAEIHTPGIYPIPQCLLHILLG